MQSLDEFLGRDNEHLRLRPFQYDDENYDEIPSEPLYVLHCCFVTQEMESFLDIVIKTFETFIQNICMYCTTIFNTMLCQKNCPGHIETSRLKHLRDHFRTLVGD